jgi:hypothetical protein
MRPLPLLICCAVLTSCGEERSGDWLEGRWAVDRQACDSAWLTYRRDGTWGDYLQQGRWRRDGLNLRTSVTQVLVALPRRHFRAIDHSLCHSERLQRVGDDEVRTTWEDGTTHRLIRCRPTEITFPHPACLGDCERVTPFDESPWNTGPPAATRFCSR